VRALRVAILAIVGAALGLAWNGLSGRGIALTGNVYLKPGDQLLSVQEAKRRFDKGAVLLVDARVRLVYELERIPGALSLPEDEFESSFAPLESRLRGRYDIAVYCDGFGCEASHDVARLLKEHGIPASVMEGGIPAWREAGYPLTTEPLP
jgi:rhodanese-related sulfurtransferase